MSKKKAYKTKEFAWKKIEVVVSNKETPIDAARRNIRCHLCGKHLNDKWECVQDGIYLVFVQEDIKK